MQNNLQIAQVKYKWGLLYNNRCIYNYQYLCVYIYIYIYISLPIYISVYINLFGHYLGIYKYECTTINMYRVLGKQKNMWETSESDLESEFWCQRG